MYVPIKGFKKCMHMYNRNANIDYVFKTPIPKHSFARTKKYNTM